MGLEVPLGLAAAADKGPVLLDSHLHGVCHLALALSHESLDMGDDLVNDLAAALHLDGVAVGVLLRELDGARQRPLVIRTASIDDDLAKGSTTSADEGPVVLPLHLDRLDNRIVKDGLLLLQGLLGRGHLCLGALDLDFHLVLGRLLGARDINLGPSRLPQLL